MPAAPLRLGFIGCGSVVERFHLPALRRVAAIEVAALADSDAARSRDLSRHAEGARCYADASSLIASDVQAVAVCVPPEAHARLGLQVLRAGKHLFLEKPLALTLADADTLVDAAGERSVVAMSGFNLRGHRAAREARKRIASGAAGRVRRAVAVFTQPSGAVGAEWRWQPGRGGDALLDLGVHHFDLLRFLLGAEFEEVRADASPDGTRANVLASLSGGVRAEIRLGADTRGADTNEITLETDRGRIAVSFYRAIGLRGRAAGVRTRAALIPGAIADRWRGGAYPSSYRQQWVEFARAVATGAGGHAMLDDARVALAVALAAAESARSGSPVALGAQNAPSRHATATR